RVSNNGQINPARRRRHGIERLAGARGRDYVLIAEPRRFAAGIELIELRLFAGVVPACEINYVERLTRGSKCLAIGNEGIEEREIESRILGER
ncbi:MAG TPA: hypothetical protein VIT23_02510, partial [Terrimicrobiaceae bacterium]